MSYICIWWSLWVQAILIEPVIWCDNISAIALSANHILRSRTKHIDMDYHFIREAVLSDALNVQYVPTYDQKANIVSKPLSTSSFLDLRAKLSVTCAPKSFTGGELVYLKCNSLVRSRIEVLSSTVKWWVFMKALQKRIHVIVSLTKNAENENY